MSNSVYPTLAGLGFDTGKSPSFNTLIQKSVSGAESRSGLQFYPMWNFDLKYNFLRDVAAFPELRSLGGHYLSHWGPLDSWLFSDPDDGFVTNQSIGTGNGSNLDFQLLRTFGTFTEPVFYPNTITGVRVGGAAATFTNLGLGVVRITSGTPGVGVAVDWTGTYYFRCRFSEDKMDFKKFMHQLWQQGSVKFLGSLQDKLA